MNKYTTAQIAIAATVLFFAFLRPGYAEVEANECCCTLSKMGLKYGPPEYGSHHNTNAADAEQCNKDIEKQDSYLDMDRNCFVYFSLYTSCVWTPKGWPGKSCDELNNETPRFSASRGSMSHMPAKNSERPSGNFSPSTLTDLDACK